MQTPFRIALIGRPNVGKSTLFNKLCGKALAIVDDRPGVTRDYREAQANLAGHIVTLIDTAGLEDEKGESMFGRMRRQTEQAIETADLLLFMIDGREGITPLDSHFAGLVRKNKQPKLLIVNKCESQKGSLGLAESYQLGLGEPIAISSEHGHGFGDLIEVLHKYIPEDDDTALEGEKADEIDEDWVDAIEGDEDFELKDDSEEESKKPLKIAIVGRPNVGKSTLVNALLEEERVMTGPEAGVTRDAIAVDWSHEGRDFKLVDTAGLRRKSKVTDVIEKRSAEDSYRAIRLAQIVVLVLDGTLGIDKQDLMIAAHAIEEGRCLIIAVNKWDIIEDRNGVLDAIKYRLDTSLSQLKRPPLQTLSAINRKNLDKLMDKVLETYETWNQRVSTGKLNRWLRGIESRNPAPLVHGRSNRLRYIAQINTRPPTFALWVSVPKAIGDSYKRYIINALREDFDLPQVPIRLLLRTSKNPYKN